MDSGRQLGSSRPDLRTGHSWATGSGKLVQLGQVEALSKVRWSRSPAGSLLPASCPETHPSFLLLYSKKALYQRNHPLLPQSHAGKPQRSDALLVRCPSVSRGPHQCISPGAERLPLGCSGETCILNTATMPWDRQMHSSCTHMHTYKKGVSVRFSQTWL